LPWFRRRKNESDVAAARTAAPPVEVRPDPIVTTAPAAATEGAGASTDPNRPKRRRGSRGGKGRKKPGTGTGAATTGDAAATADGKAARPEKKPAGERARPERKAV
jgi:hypothetical protein